MNSTVQALRAISDLKRQIDEKNMHKHLLEFAQSFGTDEFWAQIEESDGHRSGEFDDGGVEFRVTCPAFNDGDPCIPGYWGSYILEEYDWGPLFGAVCEEWERIVPGEHEYGFCVDIKNRKITLVSGVKFY